MKQKAKRNPLRSLVEFWQLTPKGIFGWNPHTTRRGLFKDLQAAISAKLGVPSQLVSDVWYGKIEELPEEFLVALGKNGMNHEKVTAAYKDFRYETIIKPIEDRKKRAEQAKLNAKAKAVDLEKRRVKTFMDDWA